VSADLYQAFLSGRESSTLRDDVADMEDFSRFIGAASLGTPDGAETRRDQGT
jgi:hypothetical protein